VFEGKERQFAQFGGRSLTKGGRASVCVGLGGTGPQTVCASSGERGT